MPRLTQPIKWHGGKHYLAKWIISHMPPHLHYVEPYFGGGAVLLLRDIDRDWMGGLYDVKLPSYHSGASEVVNDINGELINFWRVLQDEEHFARFQRRIEATPFSANEWSRSLDEADVEDPIDRAARFFVCARQSRQGLMKDFATLSRNRTRRRMNEQAASWMGAISGLPDIHQRLRGVVILEDDACRVIEKQDGELTLYYCDPPYLHETRVTTSDYAFEMEVADHERLLGTLSKIEGQFLLSGYHSELYDDFAATHGWECKELEIDNKASGRSTKQKMVECLWMKRR